MKNKIAFVFWLCIAMLYFVSTHSLWAQFAPPPPAIIVPACGESGGYIDVEIGNYPAIDIQWEKINRISSVQHSIKKRFCKKNFLFIPHEQTVD